MHLLGGIDLESERAGDVASPRFVVMFLEARVAVHSSPHSSRHWFPCDRVSVAEHWFVDRVLGSGDQSVRMALSVGRTLTFRQSASD